MSWRVFPPLMRPGLHRWDRSYPGGLGPSVLSSRPWLMRRRELMGPPWEVRMLRGSTSRGNTVSLPVLATRDRWGRFRVTTGAAADCVAPIEGLPTTCEEAVPAIIQAIQTPYITWFECWLPPWCPWRSPDVSRGGCLPCPRAERSPWCSLRPKKHTHRLATGTLTWSSVDVFLIPLRTSPEEHFARNVQPIQRQHLRASYRAGLEVCRQPSPDLVDEYYNLYSRIFDERQWLPPKLPRSFFHDTAGGWGKASEVIVMRHEGRVIGGGVFLYDRFALNLYHAVTDRTTKGVYPHPVLYQLAIECAASRGLRYVNLGYNPGAEGLIRFKRAWGAEPTPMPVLTWRGGWRAIAQNACDKIKTVFCGNGVLDGPVDSARDGGLCADVAATGSAPAALRHSA